MKENNPQKKKVYLSGPITGYDLDERREYFQAVEDRINLVGEGDYIIINPLKNQLPFKATYKEHMRHDLRLLLDCEYIYQMYGWEDSLGCRIENEVAITAGILPFGHPLIFEHDYPI